MEEHSDLIKALEDYVHHFNSGDSEKVAGYYAKDAVIAPPVGPELNGRGPIQFYYRKTFQQMAPQLSDYRPVFEVMGDQVVVRETWSVALGRPAGRHFETTGKGLWLARKVPGEDWSGMQVVWSLARFDKPLPNWLRQDSQD